MKVNYSFFPLLPLLLFSLFIHPVYTQCPSSQYYSEVTKTCAACLTLCEQCSSTEDNCVKCADGLYDYDGHCVTSCPEDTSTVQYSRSCRKSIDGALLGILIFLALIIPIGFLTVYLLHRRKQAKKKAYTQGLQVKAPRKLDTSKETEPEPE